MDLIKCPRCGEEYSASYPTCPFCEEDEDSPSKLSYKPKRRIAPRAITPSARGGMIAVLILVLALLGWYLFGDRIPRKNNAAADDPGASTAQPEKDAEVEPSVPAINADPFLEPEQTPAGDAEPGGETEPPEETGEGETAEPPAQPTETEPATQTDVDVSGAKLNRSDFTLGYSGEKFQIKLSGTEATPTWSIDNANVASISADGTVTALANGTTTVRCKVGSRELTCVVRVTGTGKSAAAASQPTTAEAITPVQPTIPAQQTPAGSGETSGNAFSSASGGSSGTASLADVSVRTNYGRLAKEPSTGYPDCTVRIGGDPISLSVVDGSGKQVSVTWATENAEIVQIDSSSGRLTPVKAGTTHVTASAGAGKITCIIRVR